MDGPDQPLPSDTAHASKVASLWQLIPLLVPVLATHAAQGRPLETHGRSVGWWVGFVGYNTHRPPLYKHNTACSVSIFFVKKKKNNNKKKRLVVQVVQGTCMTVRAQCTSVKPAKSGKERVKERD